MNLRKLLTLIALALAIAGGFYLYKYEFKAEEKSVFQTKEEESDVNVRFIMEAFDKIQANYWMKPEQYNLPQIIMLSLEKVLGPQGSVVPTDRNSTATAVSKALSATSSEYRRDVALNAVAITLVNLEPFGRNGLLSEKQEKEFRNVVSNINPGTGQPDPTLSHKIIGKTLYLDIKQIAPTTLQEIYGAMDKASTTPGVDTLIVDLRGNFGGSLDFLPAFLGVFIGEDQYAFDLFSKGEKNVVRTTKPKFSEFQRYKEIAFLSDKETQSTAELTIDAFRRYKLGKSVGTVTKGWGTVENTYALDTKFDEENKYLLLLVNNLTVRNDNQPIEGNGVLPDVDTSKTEWASLLYREFSSGSLISALKQVVK